MREKHYVGGQSVVSSPSAHENRLVMELQKIRVSLKKSKMNRIGILRQEYIDVSKRHTNCKLQKTPTL